MHTTLFGERKYNHVDWAKFIIRKGYDKPFLYFILDTDSDQGILIVDDKGQVVQDLNRPGIYAIYHGNECLYVGFSLSDVRYRLSRWKKELAGKSRWDESHPGAKKARRAGYKITDLFKVKFLPLDEIQDPKFDHLKVQKKQKYIDEYIAPLLKSKFNKKVRK